MFAALLGFGLRAVPGLKLRAIESSHPQAWVPVLTSTDKDSGLLDFASAKLIHNNLGGAGPDTGDESMIISNTGLFGNLSIMVKISLMPGYTYNGKSENNGLSNGILTINILGGAETSFLVEILDGLSRPLVLPRFFMSILDIDAGSLHNQGNHPGKAGGVEVVAFSNISAYYKMDSTKVYVIEGTDYGTSFIANMTGSVADNPSSAWDMNAEQKEKTVVAEFRDLSSYRMSLRVYQQEGSGGRNFMVTGVSDLIAAPFGECSEAVYLDLKGSTVSINNLDNADPTLPKQLRFEKAGRIHGTSVDLWIEWLDGSYNPPNPLKNGLSGQLGQINMGATDTAKFRFSFVKKGTQEPVELSDFFFEFYDIDQDKSGIEMLMMESGAGTYFPGNALNAMVNGDGKLIVQSHMTGSAKNNPNKPENSVKANTITFFFDEPLSYFDITYSVVSNAGRNFLFGGMSDAACSM